MKPTKIISLSLADVSISKDEHQSLIAAGSLSHNFWSDENAPAVETALREKFKKGVKDRLYFQQSRRCCYCGIELPNHGQTYDLEHVVPNHPYKQFMFSWKNLALACKPCNRAKWDNDVFTKPKQLNRKRLPLKPNDYLIVHPHIDEWSDHLDLDEYRRVCPKAGSTSEKGPNTISICKIYRLNVFRLADHFGLTRSLNRKSLKVWERIYLQAMDTDLDEHDKLMKFLQSLAARGNIAAEEIVTLASEQ